MKHLLLLSNSTNAGEQYLEWPREFLKNFYHRFQVKEILFIPYAGVNLSDESLQKSFDVYEQKVAQVFVELGFTIRSIHKFENPLKAVKEAEAIAVGGGNTFHLVYMMHRTGVMKAVRERVLQGIPYAGWSAGANVACPTMKTTNDMPIIEPDSFHCLNLIPFQINPHYIDTHPPGFAGETRQQRIAEFLAINRDVRVVGLREGTLLEIHGEEITLKGGKPLTVLEYGKAPLDYTPNDDLSFLMK